MLEALGNLGDFIGGIAVVVTLVYLALQIRQNTAALQAASRQEIAAGFREYNRLFMDPAVSRASRIGLGSFPDMSEEDRSRFACLAADHALFFQAAFALHESGTLEDETYAAYLQFYAAWVSTPGGAAWWREARRVFPPRMVAAVDERIARGDVLDLLEIRAFPVPSPAGPGDTRPEAGSAEPSP